MHDELFESNLAHTTSGVANTGLKLPPGLGIRLAVVLGRGTPLSKIWTIPSTPAATIVLELPATGTAAGLKTPATHGFFVGYAPADKPEIVVLVYLEHGRGMDAAAIAGPVITAWWKNR